jgi:preprotein translocase subunit SecE
MACIQKKKAPDQKKRKYESDNSHTAAAGSEEAAGAKDPVRKEIVAQNGPGKDQKKKFTPIISRSSGPEQSAIMKMIDRYFGTWIQFFREVRFELEKVAWPTRKQTIGSTAVVLVFVFILALFLGVVDMGLSSLIRLIL